MALKKTRRRASAPVPKTEPSPEEVARAKPPEALRDEDRKLMESRQQREERESQEQVSRIMALMQRYWGGLTNADLELLPTIAGEIRESGLTKGQIRLMRIYCQGGTGAVGERRENLRALLSELMAEAA